MKSFKKSLLALALLALGAAQANAGIIFSEGFDDVGALVGNGWQFDNTGSTPGGTTQWFQGNTGVFDSHEGAADSYVAANFNAAPAGGYISLYLAAPTLLLTDGDTISFWTRTESESFFGDNLLVGIFGDPSGIILLEINPGNAAGQYPTHWTQYVATVSGLGGSRMVNFGFLYDGPADDLNYIGIDSLEVSHVPEPGSLALLGLGLAAIGVTRRRRLA